MRAPRLGPRSRPTIRGAVIAALAAGILALGCLSPAAAEEPGEDAAIGAATEESTPVVGPADAAEDEAATGTAEDSAPGRGPSPAEPTPSTEPEPDVPAEPAEPTDDAGASASAPAADPSAAATDQPTTPGGRVRAASSGVRAAADLPAGWRAWHIAGSGYGTAAGATGATGRLDGPPGGGTWVHTQATESSPGTWAANLNVSTSFATTPGQQYQVTWYQTSTPGGTLKMGSGHRLTSVTPIGTWERRTALVVADHAESTFIFAFRVTAPDGALPEAGVANVSIDLAPPSISGDASARITAGQSAEFTFPVQYAGSCLLLDAPGWMKVRLADDMSHCVLAVTNQSMAGSHDVQVAVTSLRLDVQDRHAFRLEVDEVPKIRRIEISPSSISLAAGTTQSFTVRGFSSTGDDLGDITADAVINASNLATCTDNACGSEKTGHYTVRASYGGFQSTASLSVTPAALDRLTLTPGETYVQAGTVLPYETFAYDRYDNEIGDVTTTTTFSIDAPATCSANACGAEEVGDYTVTASYGGGTATSPLRVTPAALDHLTITPLNATIAAGTAQAYETSAWDRYDNLIGDVTSATTFATAAPATCTEHTCGAEAGGDYTITASLDGETVTATLTVTPAAVDRLVITPGVATVIAGGTQAFTAQTYDEFDNLVADVTDSATFSVDPPATCTANTCGTDTAGHYTVTGAWMEPMTLSRLRLAPGDIVTATAALRVSAGPLATIALTPPTATVAINEGQAYVVAGFDAHDNPLGDLTDVATFAGTGAATCDGPTCSSPRAGRFEVTARVESQTATAVLTVQSNAVATGDTNKETPPAGMPTAGTPATGTTTAGLPATGTTAPWWQAPAGLLLLGAGLACVALSRGRAGVPLPSDPA